MAKYRKKPIVIEATQWCKNGDHPNDGGADTEGAVVRYYRRPDDPGDRQCEKCSERMHDHGWIDTLEGGHVVCPGDFIITGVKGERYPCKPDIFEATYEPEEGREALNEGYAEQLEEVKDILIREGVLTAEEVARDGVRFALKHRFEPKPKPKPKREEKAR